MTTITTRQINYINDLREGFTPDQEAIARNCETLAGLMRRIDMVESALMARATHGLDESTIKGRRQLDKAIFAYRQELDAMESDELHAKRDEILATIPTFAAERVADIEWAENADLDTMTSEEASRAIDILKRVDFIFTETLPPFEDQLAQQFTAWYAAQ